MTQPFTDALTWVPKSRALGATLQRANDLARAQGHPAVTLEHILLGLIEDPDASAVLLACNLDLLRLNSAVSQQLQQQPASSTGMPEAAPAVVTILEYAVAAARQSKRNEVNGAIVLAAVVGEGNSEAARLLKEQGLTFEDAVQALKRASTTAPARQPPPRMSPPAEQAPIPAVATAPQVAQPVTVSQPLVATQHDDDPVTTARRRIEAMRAGLPMPAPAQNTAAAPTAEAGPASADSAPAAQRYQMPPAQPAPAGSDWVPPAAQPPPTPAMRPPRMPPPMPPISAPPQRANGSGLAGSAQAAAPWTDPNPGAAEVPSATVIPFPTSRAGMPIEPSRLIETLPQRMKLRVGTTVEIRIPRSAVQATAAAVGAAPDSALTRTLTVRLKAPNGGFHIETPAPETQWFDVRSSHRDDDEVRWRWIVTPHMSGRHPLQLSIGMRTVATDGVMIETTLPENLKTVRVIKPLGPAFIRAAALIGAALAGGLLALAATGNLGMLMRAFG